MIRNRRIWGAVWQASESEVIIMVELYVHVCLVRTDRKLMLCLRGRPEKTT
jgi:hypothetical protein